MDLIPRDGGLVWRHSLLLRKVESAVSVASVCLTMPLLSNSITSVNTESELMLPDQ